MHPVSSDLDLFGGVSAVDTGERSAFDFYPTPAWATRSLLAHERDIWVPGTVVLECCSGRDDITTVLRRYGCLVVTNDLDPAQPAQWHRDAAEPSYWRSDASGESGVDWVVTNPPFNVAFPILIQAYDAARRGVAFLLRKTFLEPTDERGMWLSKHPPSRMIGLPRHNFRGDGGSDSVSCDWYVWVKHTGGYPPIVIDHLAKRRVRDEVELVTLLGHAAHGHLFDHRALRAKAAYLELRGEVSADIRQCEIDALPAKDWKGRRVHQIRCRADISGHAGKGPHDVWVPTALLWALVDLRTFRCPYHV